MEEIIINQFFQSFSTPLLDLFFKAITYLGHPAFWIVIAAWLYWIGKEKKSFILVSMVSFSLILSGALKMIIARPRPSGIIIFDDQSSYSMPSGHATLISTVTTFYFTKIKTKEKYLLIIAVILVGISRIYLGAHFLSDVLMGMVLGFFIGKFFLIIEKRIEKSQFHFSRIKKEAELIFLVLMTIIAIILLPNEYNGAFIIIGYYFGHVINTHIKPKQEKEVNIFSPKTFLNLLTGTMILLIISLIAEGSLQLESISLYFIGGLFITLVWPLILRKVKL